MTKIIALSALAMLASPVTALPQAVPAPNAQGRPRSRSWSYRRSSRALPRSLPPPEGLIWHDGALSECGADRALGRAPRGPRHRAGGHTRHDPRGAVRRGAGGMEGPAGQPHLA
ncbi:hypothetical protein AB5I41_21050 [Sphingomonas sp. MMS24-JH45]